MLRRLFSLAGAAARQPAVHFLTLGALLATLDAASTRTPVVGARPPIVITAARVAEIRDEYAREVAAPSPDELAALVAHAADEEMLYREALALGLDRGDRAVMWRIVEKMHFLFGDQAGDTATAYRRGLELGLGRDDLVVRNALITKMRLMAKAASRSEEPTGAALENELEAYLQAHADDYRQADRLSLTQVFLSADVHGVHLDADANALAERLRRESPAPASAARWGDVFVAGSAFRETTPRELAKSFGETFATTVAGLPLDRWSAPIRSPYGVHLVWMSARTPAELPPLTAVRERVLLAYRAERRSRYLDRLMDELRAAYPVQVDHAG